jgi:NAD(P)-dependent dehydrogenase (short-subunit alcohol dehydrogenase family)
MKLDGKVALVTGGASGLGRATVETLAAGGATVVICDLASSDGEAVAEQLGERVRFVPTDVTSEADVQAAVDAATDLGGLHIAVNCAGVGTPGRVVGKKGPLPLEQFAQVVTINLVGTFNVTRLAAARMLEAEAVAGERGVVVNTASIAAFDGQVGQAAYAASKGGVVGMTLSLARDLADKQIRVMTIAPGTFATPMLAGLPQEAQDSLAAQIPHPNRMGDPAEFGALVRHIVENPMLNGEVIRLDGALRMGPR